MCVLVVCSRLHQIAKLYLFSASSGLYSCPLAMTDGAAKILKVNRVSFLNELTHCNLYLPFKYRIFNNFVG